jgi:hypothetical protein
VTEEGAIPPDRVAEVSFATGWRRIEYSVTSGEDRIIVAKSTTAAMTPLFIRAHAAKSAWFQEGD